MQNIEFQLLGKADNSNPSSIPLETIQKWEDENIITYLGVSEDVREHIANASCIVLPSYREGIPIALLEAMSMGKPIITTDVAGCKEVIFEKNPINNLIQIGKNGILCQPKNTASLQNALHQFLSLDEDEREKMGKEGRKYAKEIFDIKNIIDFYQKKLKSIPPNTSIAFVSNTSFGMAHFRIHVLKALQNLGFSIHILAPIDNTTQKLLQEGFFHHHIDISPKGLNPLKDIKTFFQIKKTLKKISPSICFSYTIKPVIYASFASRILKIPNIAMITGLGYVFVSGGIKKKILKSIVCKMYQIALKKTSEVWFLNPDDKDEFLQNKIIPPSKASVLKSEGVDTEHFTPRSKNNPKVVFLLIARMLWDKGVGEFVQAAKNLKNNS